MIQMTFDRQHLRSIQMDGHYVNTVRQKLLQKDFSENAVNRIFENSADLLTHCPDSKYYTGEHLVGIMIGKVQSGKTSNFIGLTALALDNGYNSVVVLGGTKKNLVSQTKKRMIEYIEDAGNIHVLAIGGEKADNDYTIFNSLFLNDQVRYGNRIVLVVLKTKQNLDLISTAFKLYYPANGPVLIIDDEGDEATPNTKVFQHQQSSTFANVINLIHSPQSSAFITVTATPQANFLIASDNELSPEFGTLVQPGEGYCGLSVFHGDQRDRYCRIISDDDSEMMEDLTNGFPRSFLEAFSMFFTGAAIRRYRGDEDKHAMLIHTSSSKDSHVKIAKAVNELLKKWNNTASLKKEGINDDSYSKMDQLFRKAYRDFSNTCVALPEYEDMEPFIIEAIGRCCKQVLICNGDIDDSDKQKFYDNNIIVGGNKLQRGITIPGLSVTYMTRRAKKRSTVDTTEQRARWLGYRMKHLDVCRVYITEQISKDYTAILEHEEDFWYHVSLWLREGYSFKEIPRIMTLSDPDSKLNFTRTNVARSEKLKISEWTSQTRVLLNDNLSLLNHGVVEKFFQNHHVVSMSWGKTKHSIVYNVPWKDVELLLDEVHSPHTGKFSNSDINIIKSLMEENKKSPNVDIIWLRPDSPQKRKVDVDGRIEQLFSGSNSNYPGDRFFDADIGNPENIKLQIHFIYPKLMGDGCAPALAFAMRIPTRIRESMDKHIRKGDTL